MKRKFTMVFISTLLMLMVIVFLLYYNGVIHFNNPSTKKYPVRGIDVSSYQGDIDWNLLSKENINFTFIKATEGSSYQDDKYNFNFSMSSKTNLIVGAYHFFSYDSSGTTQAENYINTVNLTENNLPPVIDIEFYGDKGKNSPDKIVTINILNDLILTLEEHYGVKPILYATNKSYNLYLKEEYTDYPIWIRNVFTYPKLPENKEWTFWQYTSREKLKGYEGKEKYIDMNVFNGTKKELNNMLIKQ